MVEQVSQSLKLNQGKAVAVGKLSGKDKSIMNKLSVLKPKKLGSKGSGSGTENHLQTSSGQIEKGRMSMQHILYADTFVNNSIEVHGGH